MTNDEKHTIGICVSDDIIDFINERIKTKVFADVSHAFELMAFEYMKQAKAREEGTLDRIERIAIGTMKKSVEVARETAETAVDTTSKVYHDSSERVRETGIGKTVADSAGTAKDTTMKAVEFSSARVKDSVGVVKERVLPTDGEDEDQEKDADRGRKIDIED